MSSIQPPDFRTLRDERKLLVLLQALTRGVNRAENITGGPGIEVHKTAGGIGLSIPKRKASGAAPAPTEEDCDGGDIQSLSIVIGTQDEDEWDRTSGNQLLMSVITDIGWDAEGGNIVGRIRSLHFDRCGKLVDVGPEGDWAVLVSTEACDP